MKGKPLIYHGLSCHIHRKPKLDKNKECIECIKNMENNYDSNNE